MATLQSTHPAVRPVSPWIWPGILIAGPTLVVVASIITAFFVIRHPDGLVASDYYKQGKAINAQLSQLQRANELGWSQLKLQRLPSEIVISHPDVLPARIPVEVTLAHPVDPARDIKKVLDVGSDGRYHLPLEVAIAERRRVYIADFPAHTWRLETVFVPAQSR